MNVTLRPLFNLGYFVKPFTMMKFCILALLLASCVTVGNLNALNLGVLIDKMTVMIVYPHRAIVR